MLSKVTPQSLISVSILSTLRYISKLPPNPENVYYDSMQSINHLIVVIDLDGKIEFLFMKKINKVVGFSRPIMIIHDFFVF